jgi:FAD/FMN-containing dehydrogenase
MVQVAGEVLESLRSNIDGELIEPEHADYDAARRVWNADIDRRPALIARCASADDVRAAVLTAAEAGMEIAVRGGAHSFPGYSVGDGALVIDLSRMNQVRVDAETRRARVQGGALLGDLDAAAQAHGLASPAGMISHTGVGGLTLGGGMGWLSRLAGLSIDNLVSAEIVVADGRILRVDDRRHPDLFWAIRGGGGNFGVVTEFEFRLHEVGPMVQFGLFFWGLDQGTAALRLMRDLVHELPVTVNAVPVAGLTTPPAPFVPPEFHFQTGYALLLTGFGDPAEHERAVERVRSSLPPLFELVTPMPYTALQSMLDEPNAWGSYGYDKGAYLADLTDEVIDVLTAYVPKKTSPLSVLIFYWLDGAYSEVAEDATAFGGPRAPCYFGNFIGLCPAPEMLPAERQWIRSLADDLAPYTLRSGSYVNVMPEPDVDEVQDVYGAKFARLQAVKAAYDPGNVFHRNANIPPEATPTTKASVQ